MLLSYHIDFLYYLISLNTEYFTIIVGSKSATDVADFLDDRGDDITITEELFRAAAGNIRYGNEIMKLLRKQRREEVKVTAKVVLAAAENTGVGKEVIELLLERQPEDHVVTESVRRGAAQNLRYGIKIRELLVDYRTSQVAQRVVEALVQRSHDMDKRSRILAEQRDEFLRGSLSSTQTDLRTLESDESIRSYTLSGSNISGFDETEIEEGSSVYVDHLPDLSPPLDPELGISASYLPCTFSDALGCAKIYSIHDITAWIRHSISHFFSVGPPVKCVCIFCDKPGGQFYTPTIDDEIQNWYKRMFHISDHYACGALWIQARPDYFVLDHLAKIGGMTPDDYQEAIRYTERPAIDGLVDPEVESPAQLRERRERQRQARVYDDLEKEKRMLKRLAKNKERA